MFQILYTKEAAAQLSEIAKFDPKSAKIIFDHINKLPRTYQSDPFLSGIHFKGLKRNRIGKYRAIYRLLEEEKEIHIITIAFRKSVYD